MLNSIGWGEVVVLALAAMFIFGPERLPSLAREAAGALRRLRGALTDLRGQVGETLGEDLAPLQDLDLRRYHPRTLLREQLLGEAVEGGRSDPVGP
jgi:sec-independent protein translocase protein TatB